MMQRVKFIQKNPKNPLFEKWLSEWKTAAENEGSEARHTYGRALKSLQKYPLVLKSGKECLLLENVGKKICDMLDRKLEDYKKGFTEDEWNLFLCGKGGSSSSLQLPVPSSSSSTKPQKKLPETSDKGKVDKRPRQENRSPKSRGYVPKYRSGAYALLLALLHNDGATKAVLIREAAKFCDVSFTKASEPGSFYTAWSSMATLLKNGLVVKETKSNFNLTEEGRSLASRLNQFTEDDLAIFTADTPPLNSPTDGVMTLDDDLETPDYVASGSATFRNDLPSHPTACSSSSQSSSLSYMNPAVSADLLYKNNSQQVPHCSSGSSSSTQPVDEPHETVFLFGGQFQIVLLVDTHETEMKGKIRIGSTLKQLVARGVTAETRHLAVGDFVWIARSNNGVELTLPYVVERKRLDDFASSIKDGRFKEQKFRLKGCGIPNVIYLVEKYGKDTQKLGLPLSTVLQAAANTQIADEFALKITNSLDDSMLYLACVTRQIIRLFKDKTLMSCPKENLPELNISEVVVSLMSFKQFNKESVKIKHWTVKEMLIKQLVQLKGLSVDRATAIADRYPTPSALITGLSQGGEKLLADVPYSALRKIGPAIAKPIHQLYTVLNLP